MIAQLAFSTIDLLKNNKSISEVKGTFGAAVANFGVNSFIICEIPPDAAPGPNDIHASGWNPEWLSRYAENKYAEHDPVPNAVNSRVDPYYWGEVEKLYSGNDKAAQVMNEARSEFDMRAGYCVPVHGLRANSGVVSMATNQRNWMLTPQEESALHVISLYAYEAVRKIRHAHGGSGGTPRLSPREIECIKWISVGKTSWEIGAILGISEATVSEYIKTASRKLGTVTRAHLVARAHRLSIIH